MQVIQKANNFPRDTATGGGSTWDPTIGQLTLFCGVLCFFGFFLAIPLRSRLVIRLKLPFPYATASAEAILALYDTGGSGTVRTLLSSLCPAVLFKVGCACLCVLCAVADCGMIVPKSPFTRPKYCQ